MKFRKKPVVIEAIQWMGFNLAEIANFMNGNPYADAEGNPRMGGGASMFIKTLEGEMEAKPGDWIIKGVKGEFYPCKPDIFAATYEAVNED